jgi:hypothetical protein
MSTAIMINPATAIGATLGNEPDEPRQVPDEPRQVPDEPRQVPDEPRPARLDGAACLPVTADRA